MKLQLFLLFVATLLLALSLQARPPATQPAGAPMNAPATQPADPALTREDFEARFSQYAAKLIKGMQKPEDAALAAKFKDFYLEEIRGKTAPLTEARLQVVCKLFSGFRAPPYPSDTYCTPLGVQYYRAEHMYHLRVALRQPLFVPQAPEAITIQIDQFLGALKTRTLTPDIPAEAYEKLWKRLEFRARLLRIMNDVQDPFLKQPWPEKLQETFIENAISDWNKAFTRDLLNSSGNDDTFLKLYHCFHGRMLEAELNAHNARDHAYGIECVRCNTVGVSLLPDYHEAGRLRIAWDEETRIRREAEMQTSQGARR